MSIPVDFCKKRMRHLKMLMEKNQIDLVYLTNKARGGSRFKRIADTTSGTALIIPIDGVPQLFCYSVDFISTREESWIKTIEIESRKAANSQIASSVNTFLDKNSKIGVDPSAFTVQSWKYFCDNLNGDLIDITQDLLPNVFFGLYEGELKFQREVSRLADIGVSAAREMMTPGITEYELAAEANYAMQRNGAEILSFQTIVSTGERSAYSHGYPTNRKLKNGEFMLIDLGPSKNGYAADETRTFLQGNDPKKLKMLSAMDDAVEEVIKSIKPGISCQKLDAISRKVLKQHGFPDYPHSLGHPLSGAIVPILSKSSEHILKKGMIFTVEPGIYLPGYGGVRMEENVVITDDGFEQLTKSPRLI